MNWPTLLPVIFMGLMGCSMLAYVVLDGYDLGVGLLMLATSWVGGWLYRRAKWQAHALPRARLWVFAGMTFSGWIATVAGWYVTEIGRQPFIVFGLLRVDEVASRVAPSMIALTLALYLTVYLALIAAYIGVVKHMAGKPADAPVPKAVPA